MTGQGTARWTVEADASAPSKSNVLKQSGRGDFPWCVRRDIALENGFVESRARHVSATVRTSAGDVNDAAGELAEVAKQAED